MNQRTLRGPAVASQAVVNAAGRVIPVGVGLGRVTIEADVPLANIAVVGEVRDREALLATPYQR
jgi:hypothetical protein